MRYLYVGSSTFFLDLLVLVLLKEKFHLKLPLATTISYWFSIAYNFTLNRFWTFNSKEYATLKKHMLFYLVLLGFNYTFTVIFVSTMGHVINYGLAKVLAVLIQLSWNFILYKKYIFVS